MKIAFEVAAAVSDELGECPLWDGQSGLLWWVDSRAPAVKRLDPAKGTVSVLALRTGAQGLPESRFAG